MKYYLFCLVIASTLLISFSSANAQCCGGGGGLIDNGQFNLGVSSSLFSTAVADVQTGRTLDGKPVEGFARLRLGVLYAKVAGAAGSYNQTKLDKSYTNQFWSVYGELGLQTSPDYLTFGNLGLWAQAGGHFGRIGTRVTNHELQYDQVLVNAGPFWGYSFGAGLEWDGMFSLGMYEISPAIVVERVRTNFFDDTTWDGIKGGVASDALKTWKVSLMLRFGSW